MNKSKLRFFGFLVFALSFFMSLPAWAGLYSLRYQDSETHGYTTLQLKQDLYRAYPFLRGRALQLQNVTLIAKSYNGMGSAQLRIGGWISGARAIHGRAFDWNNPASHTFDRVDFYNNGYDQRGPWQLIFNGQLRVREVAVQVLEQSRPGPGYPGRDYVEVICQSIGAQPRLCPVPFQVRQVSLLQQYAGGPCVANVTFFASPVGVEVRNGCRGRFAVYGF